MRDAPVGSLSRFLKGEEASGVLLMVAAAVAVAWANVAGDSYARVWDSRLTIGITPLALSKPLLLWINDGLMAVFFFLVGLEIKREIHGGELASARKAALPIAAALGGMIVPATIYGLLNAGGPGARGWGIPMATDIAFALGVLALLGRRVPASLGVFLTAVAIADDLGAVLIIAVFYTADLAWMPMGLAVLVLGALFALNRAGVQRATPYLVLGVALWVCVLKSGAHATIAGVVLAFTIPARSLLGRLEHALEPWVAFAILPLFALSNAGVRLTSTIAASVLHPVTLGVVLGLFVGKQVGVAAACWVLVRLGIGAMPSGATWRQLYGVALLCGIGFTMSLFIATLAFGGSPQLDAAKIGVLAGSLISGVAGSLVLARGAAKRGLVAMLLLYVGLDLSMASMPGAFVFDADKSVETVQLSRPRPAANVETAVMPPRDTTLVVSELAEPKRPLVPPAVPRRPPRRGEGSRASTSESPPVDDDHESALLSTRLRLSVSHRADGGWTCSSGFAGSPTRSKASS